MLKVCGALLCMLVSVTETAVRANAVIVAEVK